MAGKSSPKTTQTSELSPQNFPAIAAMQAIGEDDPYGHLAKSCHPTSTQEEELQTCQFTRAGETFMAAFDSLGSSFSQGMTQSQPPDISMFSLPDTEDQGEAEEEEPPQNDENTPVENEEFQTPPEEHNTSYCSSQEEVNPRNLQLVPVNGERSLGEIGNDGDNSPGLENLGFAEPREETRGRELVEFGVHVKNLEESPMKKIRVSEVNWASPRPFIVEVLDEEEEEEEVIASQKACEYADDVDDSELIDMVIEESDEEIGPNGAGDDDGEGMSGCTKKGGEKSVSSDGDVVGEEVGNRQRSESSDEDLVVEEVGNRQRSESSDEDLVVEEVGNRQRSVSTDGDLVEEVRNGSSSKSAYMDKEDIDALKFNSGGGGENGDHRWKEVVRKKRELPASLREKCNDQGGQKKGRDTANVDAKEDWKELFDKLAAMVKQKKVDPDAEEEDADFLETAKRRGMTFPQPRWMVT